MAAKRKYIMLILFLYPFSWAVAEIMEYTIFNRMFNLGHKSGDSVYMLFTRDTLGCPLGKENRDYRCITKQNMSIVSVGEQVNGSMHADMETIYTLDEVMNDGAVFSFKSSPRNSAGQKDNNSSTGKIFVRYLRNQQDRTYEQD